MQLFSRRFAALAASALLLSACTADEPTAPLAPDATGPMLAAGSNAGGNASRPERAARHERNGVPAVQGFPNSLIATTDQHPIGREWVRDERLHPRDVLDIFE